MGFTFAEMKYDFFGAKLQNILMVYVISIAGSTRRDQCRRQLNAANVQFEFFDAIDGRDDTVKKEYFHFYDPVVNRRTFKRALSPEEVGCYLSHIKIWEKVAVSGTPALVLEDDFMIEYDVNGFLACLPTELVQNSIIKICAAKRQSWGGVEERLSNGSEIRRYRIVSPHTTGYIIGPAAARRLLKVRSRVSRPVDIDLKHVWEHGVAIYGVAPSLVGQRETQENSTIDSGREKMKPTSKVQRFFSNMMYQARFRKSAFCYWVLGPKQGPGDDLISKE